MQIKNWIKHTDKGDKKYWQVKYKKSCNFMLVLYNKVKIFFTLSEKDV